MFYELNLDSLALRTLTSYAKPKGVNHEEVSGHSDSITVEYADEIAFSF